ncbi:MAG: amidohydrolase family protein [Firmicutes bacterium]|nr:amidohydrolase family protein [Bacillota bacterium]
MATRTARRGMVVYDLLNDVWEDLLVHPSGEVERRRCASPGGFPEWTWIPGLIDIQINGVGDVDFNREDLTPEAVRWAVEALLRRGVTRCCPTVITGPPDRIEAILRVLARACEEDDTVRQAVLGIHLEGPYLSEEDGPRGAHAREWIRDPDWREFERWQAASGRRIRVMTVAPERQGMPDFIEKATASGVTVALGHHAADDAQINAAVQAGARLVTHFGNGAHPVLPRHPNYLWTQLAHPALWLSVIGDGVHLPATVLQVVFRQKPHRTLLVSDLIADPRVSEGNEWQAIGQRVTVDRRRVSLRESPQLLAGSRTLLSDAVALTGAMIGDRLAAVEAATLTPAALLGLSRDELMRDGVVCRWEPQGLTVKWVIRDHRLVYQHAADAPPD